MKIKHWALFVCIFLVLLLASGCGQRGGSRGAAANSAEIVTPAGQFPVVTEPVTLTIGIRQDILVQDYMTNYFTKYLEEKTGINLEFQFFASSEADANTQFELMVSSNEKLPDILLFAPADWRNHGDNGVFVDMAPFFEKYAYFYNQRLEKLSPVDRERMRIAGSSATGKRYAWTRYTATPVNLYRSSNWINRVWLDRLGLRMPTTTEEFYNTLVAFRDRDPNGNGVRDEIPWIGSLLQYASEPLAFIINSFVYYPYRDHQNGFLNVTNGRLWTPWTTEEYRDALRYLNRLYREGLLAPATFTMTAGELATMVSYQRGEANKVGVFSGHQNETIRPESPAIYDYEYLVPLVGPKGVNYYPTLFGTISPIGFITKDCAYPEAAFRFFDTVADLDTLMTARLGEQGVDWRWALPEENAITYLGEGDPASRWEMNSIWTVPQNKHWHLEWSIHVPHHTEYGVVAWEDDGTWMNDRYKMYQGITVYYGKDVEEKVDLIVYTNEEEAAIREIRSSINTYREESLALFCTGAMDLERDWNTYLSTLDRMGLQRYLETAQTAYTRTTGR